MKRNLKRLLITFVAYTVLYCGLNFATYGIPHLGLPKAEEIIRVELTDTRFADGERTLTDPDDILLARNLANTLHFRPGKPEEGEPVVTFVYELQDGSRVEIAANETTVWYRGKARRLKQENVCLNLEHGCFFPQADPV